MPLNNPSKINKAAWVDSEDNYICYECALRLVDGIEAEVNENFSFINSLEIGRDCKECVAFASGWHPALFSTVRTIQEIQAQIEYYRNLNGATELDPDEIAAKIDALEWVLGEGRHAS